MSHSYSRYLKEINLIGDILFLNIVYFFSIGEYDSLFRFIDFER